jgi:hypothetical protein
MLEVFVAAKPEIMPLLTKIGSRTPTQQSAPE